MKFTASKKTIALVAAAAMLTSVAACGSSSNSSSSGVTEGGKTEITVWSWDSTLPRTVKDFEKANPDITVKVTNAGTNKTEYTALNNALSAGKVRQIWCRLSIMHFPNIRFVERLKT